jgi:hypothetical protein
MASGGGAPNSFTTVCSSKLHSSRDVDEVPIAVPVQWWSTVHQLAPRPAIRSDTYTVRKSTLNRTRPDVFGIDL